MGLRLRIFLGMLLIVLLALASTGVVAYYHAQRQDIAYNKQRLERKEAALSRSLDYLLNRHENNLTNEEIAQIFTDKICELADVHSLVFSLYALDGVLITTSASQQYGEVTPPIQLDNKSNPMGVVTRRILSVEEKEGEEVTRVYWVVENLVNEPLMIASAKYNPRKIEENALGAFLSRLAPVYFVLFLGALIIAYFTLQSIARPLLRLKQEMADSNPLSDQPKIDYKWKDDIGALVNEYNELLEKLRASLDSRAKLEREGAWKEMAQQVAHEIKNPLTPIRLGIQQLEKAWKDGAPDFESRLSKFSNTAIAQIDILSQISQDFAQLAEVRKPELKTIDLSKAINSAAGLFGPKKVLVDDVDFKVIADMDSLIRLLNNLISNAIEAVEEAAKKEPVYITAAEEDTQVIIAIKDKGVGISKDKLNRIFEPRFTTKRHGLGLGLAMAKSIAEQASGRVWAQSKEGDGSTFYLSLLKGK